MLTVDVRARNPTRKDSRGATPGNEAETAGDQRPKSGKAAAIHRLLQLSDIPLFDRFVCKSSTMFTNLVFRGDFCLRHQC